MPLNYPTATRALCPICESEHDFTICPPTIGTSSVRGLPCVVDPAGTGLAVVLKRMFPNWRNLAIHESSPQDRGISAQLKRNARGYVRDAVVPRPAAWQHDQRLPQREPRMPTSAMPRLTLSSRKT